VINADPRRKYRLVRSYKERDYRQMLRDVEREKSNAFLCMLPAISREKEMKIMRQLEAEGPTENQTWFQMRKARVEQQRLMAPVPLSEHFNSLKKEEKW